MSRRRARRRVWPAGSLTAIIAAASLCAGCSQPGGRPGDLTSDATDRRHVYRYFPDDEVYYSAPRDLYFWHGLGYWGVGSRPPSTYNLDPHRSVLVTLDTQRPYRRHAEVAARHAPGSSTTGPAPAGELVEVPTAP